MKKIVILSFVFIFSSVFILSAQSDEKTSPVPFSVVYREKIEWLDLWVENADLPETSPRVLLVGDSITKNYYYEVKKGLKKKVTVDKLATSKAVCDSAFLDEMKLVLSQYHYDVIHFNNGLHGWAYSEQQFEKGLEEFVQLLDEIAPDTKLVWATITPCRGDWRDKNARILLRNEIAKKTLASRISGTTDLFGLVEGKARYYSGDGVHYNSKGVRRQGSEVAKVIKKFLRDND